MSGAQDAERASRLSRVVLAGEALTRLSPILEADRAQAVADLEAENAFALIGPRAEPGPYALHLSIQEGRLVFDIRHADEAPMIAVGLALGPFRGLVKDYQLLVDSHIKAVRRRTRGAHPGDRHGPARPAQRGRGADDAAAGRQDRHRFRYRAPPVHPGLRAASKSASDGELTARDERSDGTPIAASG